MPVVLGLLATNVVATNDAIKPEFDAPALAATSSISIIQGDEFNIEEYLDVDTEKVTIITAGEIDTNTPGDYDLDVYAVDIRGNTSALSVTIEVIAKEVYDNYLNSHDNFMMMRCYDTTAAMNEALANLKPLKDTNAYDLAQSFIGMGGDCFYVASKFIDALYEGKGSIKNLELISAEDIEPGDVIFYYNGGLGEQHWAVYLGGSYALQGNYLGTTIIGNVYINQASDPIFYRVILAD